MYSTVTLNFDLLIPIFNALTQVPKFGENLSNTSQDIMFTMFQDAQTDAWMHAHTHGRTGQKQYAFGHTKLGEDTKISQQNIAK